MPKTTIRPSSPMMRRSSARKAIAAERVSERKAQEQERLVKENIKNRAIAALQQKQEEMREARAGHEGFDDRHERTTFMKRDPVVDFRESRQDKFISSLSANLNVMIQAVKRAGRGLMRDFGELENLRLSQKGAADFVSTADTNSEKTLREYLLKVRPRYGFLQEESGEIKGDDTSHRWIIDPLDGTMNFLHAVPHFAISLALQEDQEIIAGVIYNPATSDLFYAEKGNGAWMLTASGSSRLHVSTRSALNESVVVTGIPHLGHGNAERFTAQLMPMMTKTGGVRRMGAASLDLAYVAAGRFECYWEEDIKPWDIAAGMLMVREAGGRVCTTSGVETPKTVLTDGTILASNSLQYEVFKNLIVK